MELAEVTDPDQVATTVIAALGLDAGNRTPLDRLTGYLRERRALLVLDNCEQIVSAVAALVEAVLLACPEVSVLATSREPLGVRGEVPWRARPLTLPPAAEEEPTTDQILAAESVQLFADRAAQANAGFRVDAANAATMAAICCRLDGIPLAIELAAARVSVLRPERILDGLGDWFRLLTSSTRGAPERQQTLSASVEWSHNLLSEGERVLLRRLAVFVGAFDLEAAEAVTAADGVTCGDVLPLLIALVDKSLVGFDGEHYVLLQTIRDFATARLEAAGEAAATHDAHLRHYQNVAATAAAELSAGPQIATLEQLEAARGNLLAAVDWALDRDDHEAAARVVSDLALFWQLHGRHSESLASIRRVERALPAAASEVRARVLWAAGQLGLYSMDLPGGYGVAETGTAVEVATETGSDEVLGRALGVQGFMMAFGAPDAAVEVLAAARSAAAAARDAFGIGVAAAYSGFAAVFSCDRPEEAEPHLAELAAQLAATGSPLWAVWQGLIEGMTHWRAGRLPAAVKTFTLAEELACALGDPVLESWCAVWGSDALVDAGDLDTAERLIGRSATWMDRSSYGRFEFITSRRIRLELVRGDLGAARAACDAVEVTACEMGFPFVNVEIGLLRARFLLEDGDAAVAATRVAEAVAIADSLGTPWYVVAAANMSGRVTRALGDFARAEHEHHRALALCASHGFAVAAAETLECLASLATAGESWAEAVRLFGSAGALREQIGAPCPVLDAVLVESDLAAAREALGDDEFHAARAEGAALNLAETAAYAARARGERKRASIGWESLTQTELHVVDLVADGLTNAAIAEKMFITVGTVKVHLHHVFTKLGITRRAELAARATERRLTTTEAS